MCKFIASCDRFSLLDLSVNYSEIYGKSRTIGSSPIKKILLKLVVEHLSKILPKLEKQVGLFFSLICPYRISKYLGKTHTNNV
jgi:hypothetical protein